MSKRTNPSDRVADLGTTRIEVPSEPVIADGPQRFRRNYPSGSGCSAILQIFVGLSEANTEKWQLVSKHRQDSPGDQGLSIERNSVGNELSLYRSHPQKRITAALSAEIVKRDSSGESASSIAKSVGFNRRTITMHLKEKLELRKHKRATKAQVAEMAKMYLGGDPLATIGRRFWYSPSTVRKQLIVSEVNIRQRPGR